LESKYRLLILYHSGGGSTKTICEIYYKMLNKYSVNIEPISLEYDYKKLQNYDYFIFAFPTYHCSPSCSMLEFIMNMPVFWEQKKAFTFTTYGLYSGNTLTEFIKVCYSKNIVINGCSGYRAPATDGALLLPSISFLFNYEKKIALKIKADINKIEEEIKSEINPSSPIRLPFSLISVLNYPNKVLGRAYKHKFKLEEENCVNCNKCVNNCIRHCWTKVEKYPKYEMGNCEFCFKCIHHCPKGAIILSKRTKTKPKLNDAFYTKLKQEIIKQL
jgi:flavodoxin/NAD-dependent dihydropyrimidine dehydrogenase PreA subunit